MIYCYLVFIVVFFYRHFLYHHLDNIPQSTRPSLDQRSPFGAAPAVRIFAPSLKGEGGDTASNHIARGWVMWNAQYSCKVKSKFNLTDFPFDSQKLKLDLKILQVKYSKMFSLIVGSIQYHSGALDMSEWRICKPKVKQRSDNFSTVEVVVNRVHEYYMFNVCSLLGGLSALSALTFTCDLRANGERLGVNMTLLLTAVAFKQLIAESLPKISYLTILDKWMLLCLFSLFASTIACVVPSFFDDDETNGITAYRVNYYFAIVIGFLTVICLPGYLIVSQKLVEIVTPSVKAHPKGNNYPWHIWDFSSMLWFLNSTD